MRKLIIPGIALCAALIAGASTPAQKPTTRTKQKPSQVTLQKKRVDATFRPKAPSRQVVTCEYDGTYLTFGFVLPEGVCEATVTENFSGASQTYTFDSTPLTADIYVGELYESTVTMTTASGNTYTGSLTADPE